MIKYEVRFIDGGFCEVYARNDDEMLTKLESLGIKWYDIKTVKHN